MFMANLMWRTKLRFGTGVICIPTHDPIVIAADGFGQQLELPRVIHHQQTDHWVSYGGMIGSHRSRFLEIPNVNPIRIAAMRASARPLTGPVSKAPSRHQTR